MIKPLLVNPFELGGWEESANVAKKVGEIITAVNNMEAKLKSASPTNIDYTAALCQALKDYNRNCDCIQLNGKGFLELAAHLNAAIQKQHCA